MELKWYFVMLAVAALAAAIFGSVYYFAQSSTAKSCIAAGGSWVDTNPDKRLTTMGCVHNSNTN